MFYTPLSPLQILGYALLDILLIVYVFVRWLTIHVVGLGAALLFTLIVWNIVTDVRVSLGSIEVALPLLVTGVPAWFYIVRWFNKFS